MARVCQNVRTDIDPLRNRKTVRKVQNRKTQNRAAHQLIIVLIIPMRPVRSTGLIVEERTSVRSRGRERTGTVS